MTLALTQLPSITDAKLSSKIFKDKAVRASGSMFYNDRPHANDTFTIDTTYVFEWAGAGGNINIALGASLDGDIDAAVAAINASAARVSATAYPVGGASVGILLMATIDGAAGNAITLTEGVDAGNHLILSGAGTLLGGVDTGIRTLVHGQYAFTADEIGAGGLLIATTGLLVGTVVSTSVPTIISTTLMTAAGLVKNPEVVAGGDNVQLVTQLATEGGGQYGIVYIGAGGAVVPAATDVLHWVALID